MKKKTNLKTEKYFYILYHMRLLHHQHYIQSIIFYIKVLALNHNNILQIHYNLDMCWFPLTVYELTNVSLFYIHKKIKSLFNDK